MSSTWTRARVARVIHHFRPHRAANGTVVATATTRPALCAQSTSSYRSLFHSPLISASTHFCTVQLITHQTRTDPSVQSLEFCLPARPARQPQTLRCATSIVLVVPYSCTGPPHHVTSLAFDIVSSPQGLAFRFIGVVASSFTLRIRAGRHRLLVLAWVIASMSLIHPAVCPFPHSFLRSFVRPPPRFVADFRFLHSTVNLSRHNTTRSHNSNTNRCRHLRGPSHLPSFRSRPSRACPPRLDRFLARLPPRHQAAASAYLNALTSDFTHSHAITPASDIDLISVAVFPTLPLTLPDVVGSSNSHTQSQRPAIQPFQPASLQGQSYYPSQPWLD